MNVIARLSSLSSGNSAVASLVYSAPNDELLELETDDALHFWIRADENNATNDLAVSLYDTSNTRITRLVLGDYITLTASWQQVEIPMSDFLTEDQAISGIILQDAAGVVGEHFLIEDITIRE